MLRQGQQWRGPSRSTACTRTPADACIHEVASTFPPSRHSCPANGSPEVEVAGALGGALLRRTELQCLPKQLLRRRLLCGHHHAPAGCQLLPICCPDNCILRLGGARHFGHPHACRHGSGTAWHHSPGLTTTCMPASSPAIMCSDSCCRQFRSEMLPSSGAPAGGCLTRQDITSEQALTQIKMLPLVIYIKEAPSLAELPSASRDCLHTGTALPWSCQQRGSSTHLTAAPRQHAGMSIPNTTLKPRCASDRHH